MTRAIPRRVAWAAVLFLPSFALAACAAPVAAGPGGREPMVILPGSETYAAEPGKEDGPRTAVLAGNPKAAGLYTVRVKIPAGARLMPHSHPDERMVVVLSGTFHYAYGDRFDESALKTLPPGSFFTEPAGAPHFAWAKSGEVVVQATAVGPSGTKMAEPVGKP